MIVNPKKGSNPTSDAVDFLDRPPKSVNARTGRFLLGFKSFLLPLLIISLMVSADFLTAAQQRRLLTVTVSRHVMAALQEDADKPIDQSLRSHWITTDAQGNIEGRVSALDNETGDASPIKRLTVTLIKQGQQISKAKTDKEGRFQLRDVEAGVYTLVAWGRTGFLAYGVHVLPRLEELDLDEEDELNVRKLDRTPLTVKQRQAYYVSEFDLPADAVVAEQLQIDAAAVPPDFTTLRKISQNYMSASSAFSVLADKGDLKAIAKADLTAGGFQFPLSEEGNFHGRIQPIATEDGKPTKLSDMNLFLVQQDVEILRVAAEENGDFRMNDVEPGVYSLIAAGKDGFAALSLELVEAGTDLGDDAGEGEQGSFHGHARNSIHRVSTAAAQPNARQDADPKVNVPALGIAIVTDKQDLAKISQTLTTIARPVAANAQPIEGFNGGGAGSGIASGGFAPGGFGGGGFAPGGFAPGGFAPGGIGGAPVGTTSFAPAAGVASGPAAAALSPALGTAPGLSFGGASGGLLGLAGVIGGVVAIADDSSDAPVAASPSTIGS